MRPIPLLLTILTLVITMAEPAMAQSIDLSPIQNLLHGLPKESPLASPLPKGIPLRYRCLRKRAC